MADTLASWVLLKVYPVPVSTPVVLVMLPPLAPKITAPAVRLVAPKLRVPPPTVKVPPVSPKAVALAATKMPPLTLVPPL